MTQCLRAFVISLLCILCCGRSQAQSSLQILSPKPQSEYFFGNDVDVNISITSGATIKSIIVAISGFDMASSFSSNVEYNFRLKSDSSKIGWANVIAYAALSDGQVLQSNPVSIYIKLNPENPYHSITKLWSNPESVQFDYVGQSRPLSIFIQLSGGSFIDISKNPRTKVSFSNNTAEFDNSNGSILSKNGGIGVAKISFDDAPYVYEVDISSPNNSIRGDLNADGIVDQADLEVLRFAVGSKASGPNDARDLNRDGKIDALDLRILSTLCTYPRCASTKP